MTRQDPRAVSNKCEDLLQIDYRAFTAGFGDDPERPSDMAAYGTVMRFERVEKCVREHPELDWEDACKVWDHDSYLSPVIALTALWVRRILARRAK